ncbi:MAG: response regulator transcription factor [Edaphobacter sp.]|uniref:response regulator transcription factor n=1 Tax=Edaphobacter sp. TaxID=1934404 RepID=UPI002397088A|nr:response regulator transcription factor [Edaphobacter sp.]MDE1177932.1 response regulator transcription factor [Edaphobacter sp.]
MNPIRIFIVDDHNVVRMGLHAMLRYETSIDVVGTAASGTEALGILQSRPIDVLLTDLRMPGMGGDELLAEVRKLQPHVEAVILTNYHSAEDVFRAIKAGAMGFILKTASMEEILDAVRSVHAGQRAIPPYIASKLAEKVAEQALSVREGEVLQLMARGYRNREIANKLFISENTVRNHVINVLKKLGTTNRTEGVALSIQKGLVRLDD